MLNKLEQVSGATLMALDKLPGIHADLVHTDSEWEKWDFAKLREAIRLWTRGNPVDTKSNEIRVNSKIRSGIDHANSTKRMDKISIPKNAFTVGMRVTNHRNVKRLLKLKKEEHY